MRKNQIIIDKDSDQQIFSGEILSIEGTGTIAEASVKIDGGNPLDHVRFYYHCEPDNTDLGYAAFDIGDRVLLAKEGSKNFIIGFKDLIPKPCYARRFFARITEYDDDENPYDAYYWFFFDVGNNINVRRVEDEIDLLRSVVDIPGSPSNVFTKSFMLHNEGDEDEDILERDERFCAARHCLIKDNVIIKDYPLLADVRKFYCDTDKQILIWYGSEEGDVPARILTIRIGEVDSDYETTMGGYTACIYRGLPSYIEPDSFPSNLIADVEGFTIERDDAYLITLFKLSSYYRTGRKIYLVTHNLITDERICDDSNLTYHWVWTEDGFEQKPLVTSHSFTPESSDNSYSEESGSASDQDCSVYNHSVDECEDMSNKYEKSGGKTQTIDATILGANSYYMTPFDRSLVIAGSRIRQDAVDFKSFIIAGCFWDEPCAYDSNCGQCDVQVNLNSGRVAHNVNSIKAVFKNSNTLYVEKTIFDNADSASATRISSREFTKNSYYCENYTRFGGTDESSWEECFWKGKALADCGGISNHKYPEFEYEINDLALNGRCFLSFLKPEDSWPGVTVESFSSNRTEGASPHGYTEVWKPSYNWYRWHRPSVHETDFVHATGIPEGTLLSGRYNKHVCIQTGVSGAAEPVWNTSGGLTYDGTTIWQHIYFGPITQNKWLKTYDAGSKIETSVNRYEVDDGAGNRINFDASKITKTYFLDDRSSERSQGLVIAGYGIFESEPYWEVHRKGTNVTTKLLAALDCKLEDLQEIGLV